MHSELFPKATGKFLHTQLLLGMIFFYLNSYMSAKVAEHVASYTFAHE